MTRFDYFLIWGNGLPHLHDIIREIRHHPEFEILSVIRHHVESMPEFVRAVYSRDTVPFEHLEGKTKYLMDATPEVVAIFVRNSNVQERLYGEGEFQVGQCATVKAFKEAIRDRFNPRIGDKRTEEHVIHGSDNQDQVDSILRIIGFGVGLRHLENRPNTLIEGPHHLAAFDRFTIRKVDANAVYATILDGGTVPLEDTPHYKTLTTGSSDYADYLAKYHGTLLTDDHSVEQLLELDKTLRYLDPPHETAYIIVRRVGEDKYIIVDGVHRACVLRHHGKKHMIVAVVL